MELKRAIEIFEYNKAMLTCDMSISRDPEHQDVSPDYYGKEAEDLYNAIVCVEKYIKSAIPIEFIEAFKKEVRDVTNGKAVIDWLLEEWEEKQARLFEKQITEECVSAERFAEWEKENEGTRSDI